LCRNILLQVQNKRATIVSLLRSVATDPLQFANSPGSLAFTLPLVLLPTLTALTQSCQTAIAVVLKFTPTSHC
jgi:hypothetical protein